MEKTFKKFTWAMFVYFVFSSLLLQSVSAGRSKNIPFCGEWEECARSISSSIPISAFVNDGVLFIHSSTQRSVYIKRREGTYGTKSKPDKAMVDGYDEDLNEIKVNAVISTGTDPQNMIDYLQTIVKYSGTRKFDPNLAKQSLQNLKPVLLYGNGHFTDGNNNAINEKPYDKKPGHAWVLDGYCTTKKIGAGYR